MFIVIRPFESICKSIIRKADNEAYQTYELVESLKNGVFDPLTTKVKDFAEKIEELDEYFDLQWEVMTKGKERILKDDAKYTKESKGLQDAVEKCQFNQKDRTVDLFDDKLFERLHRKIKDADSKAKELSESTNNLNDIVSKYKKTVQEKVEALKKLEEQRIKSMVDALNQINIYQTNWDMNNKYDSNNFNETVEGINTEATIENYRKLWKEIDLYSIDTYFFRPFDELASKDDFYLSQIDEVKENEIKAKINEFINKWTSENFSKENINIDEFNELMNDKVWRFWFVNFLLKQDSFELSNESSFNGIGILVNSFLKACCKNDDSEYLRNILNLWSKYYFDVKDGEDWVIRTHLSEAIRGNEILNDPIIWTKAIVRDFRDIIKVFKLPEGQTEEVDKETILRNVLFNRLYFYISNLSYFEMNSADLTKIWNKFNKIYKFTTEQKEKLISKVTSLQTQQEIDDHFNIEITEQRSSSITKSVNSWMSKLGKLGTSAVTIMKTYIKKKNVDNSAIEDNEYQELEEEEKFNAESTDISKNNSECSPPKEEDQNVKCEIEASELALTNEDQISPQLIIEPVEEVKVEFPQTN